MALAHRECSCLPYVFLYGEGQQLISEAPPQRAAASFYSCRAKLFPTNVPFFGKVHKAGGGDFFDAGGQLLKFGKTCADEHNTAAG